jgi:hypothetical protein
MFLLSAGTTFDQVLQCSCTYDSWSAIFGLDPAPNVATTLNGSTLTLTFDTAPVAYDPTTGYSPNAYYLQVNADIAVTLP